MVTATRDEASTTGHFARNTFLEVPLASIEASAHNPRRTFDAEALGELAASIAEHGLLEPLVVRETAPERYELIAGERRLRACRLAGLETVAVNLLEDVDDLRARELRLVENLQRKDLDPIEEARGYQELAQLSGWTQSQIAARVNRSQPSIANAMRLLDLPESVLEKVRAKELSAAHARALVKYATWPALCEAIAALAIESNLTSKTLEAGLGRNSGISEWPFVDAGLLARIEQDGLSAKDAQAAGVTIFGDGYWRYTPDIDVYARLLAENRKRQQAETSRRLEAVRQTAKASGKAAPVSVEKLPSGSYTRLTDWEGRLRAPAGCPDDCPCRAVAVEKDGTQVIISTDPAHIEKLRRQAERIESKSKKDAARARAAELDEILSETPVYDARGLALVVANRLCQFKKPVAKRLIASFAADAIKPEVLDSYDNRRDTYADLAKLPIENLLQILVHGELLDSMHDHLQYGGMMPAASLVWYMEGAGRDPFAGMKQRDLKLQLREARGRLDDPKIQNQPGLWAKWKETETQLLARLAELNGNSGSVESAPPPIATVAEEEVRASQNLNSDVDVARARLTAVLIDYEVLADGEHATDAALIEFADDLMDRDDLDHETLRDIAEWANALDERVPAEAVS